METKKIWESKTFWTNVLGVVAVLVAGLGELLSTGQAVTALAVVNIVIRAVTKSGIDWSLW